MIIPRDMPILRKRSAVICVWAKPLMIISRSGAVYRLEHINISDLDSGVSEALAEQAGNSLVSSLGFSVTNDYRDSKLSPTTGWVYNQ